MGVQYHMTVKYSSHSCTCKVQAEVQYNVKFLQSNFLQIGQHSQFSCKILCCLSNWSDGMTIHEIFLTKYCLLAFLQKICTTKSSHYTIWLHTKLMISSLLYCIHVFGVSLSELHIDHDNGPARGIMVCIYVAFTPCLSHPGSRDPCTPWNTSCVARFECLKALTGIMGFIVVPVALFIAPPLLS